MNPRSFCEERGYPWSIFVTYSFDPVFFERIPLRDVQRGGGQGSLIIADRDELDRALATPSPLLRALGRSYVLAGATAGNGAFHPKIFLRLGRSGGLAWVGTGNVTHGGWGANAELASAWRVGPEHEDQGGWIRPFLEQAAKWAATDLAHEVLQPMLGLDWVRDAVFNPGQGPLISGYLTLADQLSDRWSGRRFRSMKILTGSSDRTGQMLRWAHRTFGVSEAQIVLTPSRTSFDLTGLDDLPLALEVIPSSAPPIHAKFYWFDGDEGQAAAVGSANCSAAAWLLPPATNGNVESLLIYDHADAARFSDILSHFQNAAPPLSEILPLRRDVAAPKDDVVRYRLDGIVWDPELARIEVAFGDEQPNDSCMVELLVNDQAVRLQRDGAFWVCDQPEELAAGRTVIGRARVIDDSGHEYVTPPRWMDVPHLIRQAMIGRTQPRILMNLTRPASSREDDVQIQELTRLAQDIVGDAAGFSDPLRVFARKPRRDEHTAAPVIEARELVRSLYDTVIPLAHTVELTPGSSIGISGIFRALFGDDADVDVEAEAVVDNTDEEEEPDEDKKDPRPSEPRSPPQPVSDKNRKRFKQLLDKVVEDLRATDFAARCSATQLRQAAAYPIAAVVLGKERRWADNDSALAWVKGIADLLLYGYDRKLPLLVAVRERYSEESRPKFDSIVGDGVLWVTLASALTNVPWNGPSAALHRLVLLADLWNNQYLRAATNPERIAELARRYRAQDAVTAIRDYAGPAATLITEIEELLAVAGLDMLTDPESQLQPIRAAEIVWAHNLRWGLALEDEQKGKVRLYHVQTGREAKYVVAPRWLSVRQTADRNPELRRLYDDLLSLLARIQEHAASSSERDVASVELSAVSAGA